MTNLLLGIFIGAVLVVFCLWLMERGAGVTDAEIEAWLEWREKWARRQAFEEELRKIGAEEMPLADISDIQKRVWRNVEERLQGGRHGNT